MLLEGAAGVLAAGGAESVDEVGAAAAGVLPLPELFGATGEGMALTLLGFPLLLSVLAGLADEGGPAKISF